MARKMQEASVAVRLRELKHATPFSPFRIKTSSGQTLTVTGADTFMVSPAGQTAILYPKEDRGFHLLELDQVVLIESARNGVRKRKQRSNRRGQQ